MKVRQVTKMELTSWRMALKLGRDSARNSRMATIRERKTVRFTLNAKFVILITVFKKNSAILGSIPRLSSKNWFGGFINIG